MGASLGFTGDFTPAHLAPRHGIPARSMHWKSAAAADPAAATGYMSTAPSKSKTPLQMHTHAHKTARAVVDACAQAPHGGLRANLTCPNAFSCRLRGRNARGRQGRRSGVKRQGNWRSKRKSASTALSGEDAAGSQSTYIYI
jgi:hypothetical protein